jgi:O-methyltransferase
MCPESPQKHHRVLRAILPKRLQPLARSIRKHWGARFLAREEPFLTVAPYTQVSLPRQRNLLCLAQKIDTDSISGAIVECGVLDGGTAALMALGTQQSGRPIHLFDSWSGLPKASAKDGQAAKQWEGEDVGSTRRVRTILKKVGIKADRVTFHKGWFDQTFQKADIKQIALLHIDADFYASVKLSLETWAPKISNGGYIQIDDYSAFIGCRRAVDEYLATHSYLKLQTDNDVFFFACGQNLQKPD